MVGHITCIGEMKNVFMFEVPGILELKIVTRFMCDEIQDKRSPHKTQAHVSLD
jgi:hypothetical protein